MILHDASLLLSLLHKLITGGMPEEPESCIYGIIYHHYTKGVNVPACNSAAHPGFT